MPRAKSQSSLVEVLDAYEAKADAQVDLNEISKNIKARVAGEVVVDQTVKSGLRGLGMKGTETTVTNGADVIVTLFHAFDGREVQIPLYQVENRIIQRFPRTDEVPREFWGKRVWWTREQEHDVAERPFHCRLAPRQSPEMKAEMRAAGLAGNCRKDEKVGGWPTQFEADEHFRMKHPRRWRSYQDYRGRSASSSSAELLTQAVAALVAQSVAANPPAAE